MRMAPSVCVVCILSRGHGAGQRRRLEVDVWSKSGEL